MKNQRVFIGILLIGIGLYFLIDSLNLPFTKSLFHWPMILIVIGAAFLLHGLIGKDAHSLFPGMIVFGIGFHFFALDVLPFWPRSWGMYTLIVGLAFLVQYVKTKKGSLTTAVILLIISIAELFYSGFQFWISTFFSLLHGFWPFLLILIGVYFLFAKRK